MLNFIFVCFGLTQIITSSKIFEGIRKDSYFLHCSMCVGFWVGLFLFLLSPFTQLFNFDYNVVTGLCLGCISSGTSYVLSVLFDDDGFKFGGSK